MEAPLTAVTWENPALIKPMVGSCRFEVAYVIGNGDRDQVESGNWRDQFWLIEVLDETQVCGRLKIDSSIGECRRLAELLALLHDNLAAKYQEVVPIDPNERQYQIQEYAEKARQAYHQSFIQAIDLVVNGSTAP